MTPPDSTAKVRRYYQNDAAPGGMRLDPLGPWMLTSDHDTALAERDARIAELEAENRKLRTDAATSPKEIAELPGT